ncbi:MULTISPECIES: RagB/SusD family nutrient uptake outer membrane protein [unclassified Carboxylicivirga]|uniref:RagB/SusD family nutrient uptake outer membrane protein n=1 Tax=Carboxylicivirga TaxID=1628153 RepID=UPI003D33A412
MKRLKLYILCIGMALSAASCLDKYPEHAIPEGEAMTTVHEANQVVIGIYAAFKSPALYSGYLTLLPDLQTDLAYAVQGYSNTYGDIWRWDILATNTQVSAVYQQLYTVIGRCNFFLENIEKVASNTHDNADLATLDSYKGEVYFARALAYSELIKMFCKAYDPATAENELGVVLVDSYSNAGRPTRASLKESYAFVLNDLELASNYLQMDLSGDETLFNTGYFNIGTVNALYARTYLYMQDWEKAVDYSSRVIDSNKYFLSSVNQASSDPNFNAYEYMWQYDAATEIIWKVHFEVNSFGGSLGRIFFNFDFRSYKPDYIPATWVLNSYESADLRYNAFFAMAQTGYSHGLVHPLVVKYFGNRNFVANNILHVNMPKPFRLAEQYLIRAEAYCHMGTVGYGKAAKDITTLRNARYASYGSTSLNADNWQQVIEEERVKELYMEGFRLQDLKRWGMGFERKAQQLTVNPGNNLKVEADNPLFVWPIPQHELQSPDADIQPNESNK